MAAASAPTPVPLSMARWILSLGMLASLAFCTASLPYKVLVKPSIICEFWVERRDQDVLSFSRDDSLIHLAHNLYSGPYVLKERRPDKHPHKRFLETFYLELLLERMDLPPEPVPLDERVHQAQEGLPRPRRRRRREDHPRARPPHGPALVEEAAYPIEETRVHHQVPYCRGLTARHDEAGQSLQVLDAPHLDRLDPEFLQDLDVLPDVSLEREHPDPRLPLGL